VELALHAAMPWRQRLKTRLEMPLVQRGLIALILVNAAILGLETSSAVMASWGPWLIGADKAILAVFVVEIALRLIVHRLSFFRDPWSVFDFAVVAGEIAQLRLEIAALRNDLQGVRASAPGAGRIG
jgi:voltage-gated sodium channel